MNKSEDYRGEHEAPDEKSGAPMHNLKGVYPDDFHKNPSHYADGFDHDHESISVMRSVKDRPHAPVKIYRAVPVVQSHQDKIKELEKHQSHVMKKGTIPSGVMTNLNKSDYYEKVSNDLEHLRKNPPNTEAEKIKINKGDWVTPSLTYAKDHGKGALRGKFKVLSKTVRASELFTTGDSVHEYGYQPKTKTVAESVEFAYLDMITEYKE